jgi:S-adenosylmethionine synthetase
MQGATSSPKGTDMIKTCEFVTPKHPDKICDFIADTILDVFLSNDPDARVAVEVMGGHKLITVNGEVTSSTKPELVPLIKNIVGEDFEVIVNIAHQSPFIARSVDAGGAGDQGIMMGYAVAETVSLMPFEYDLARKLCQQIYEKYPFDGKVQVTIDSGKILSVVASFQNSKIEELLALVKNSIQADEYLINPAGEWTLGGFDADSGLSGRKIVIDNYGPEFGVGGGSFSGKDYTKVDRSGAYMARRIACDLLKKHSAESVQMKLAYAIGKPQPVMAVAMVDGVEEFVTGYDLTPRGIHEFLKLDQVKFAETSNWGHFGRNFSWG